MPSTVRELQLDFVIAGFEDAELELRSPRFFERMGGELIELGLPSPTGLDVSLSWSEGAPWRVESGKVTRTTFPLEPSWTPFELLLDADRFKGDAIWAIISVEPQVAVEFRDVMLSVSQDALFAARPKAVPWIKRAQWPLDHPNLLAHTILFCALAAFRHFPKTHLLRIAIFIITSVILVATESRTAMIAWTLGLSYYLFAEYLPLKRLRRFLALQWLAAALLCSFLSVLALVAWRAVDFSRDFQRVTIWESALSIISTAPLIGSGQLNQPVDTSGAIVPHAHNVFLDHWLRFGLGGLVAAGLVIASIVRSAMRAPRRIRACFLIAVFSTQLVDATMFHTPVLMSIMFALVPGRHEAERT